MEHKFIRWLEDNFADISCADGVGGVQLGIGDDGAVVDAGEGKLVFVSDAVVDQVHFDTSVHTLERIGHKALSVNLSDIAAMGAVAHSALVSLVLPHSFSFEETKDLFTGIATTARKFGVTIVGGDTCSHSGPLMISVTATGRIGTDAKMPDGWRMDGAKKDDLIVTTGALGGSIQGKHLDFEPRLDVAEGIQKRVVIHAATDISDSLSIDLAHVLRKSNVGAILDLNSIPLTEAAQGDVERALRDGEDFELLLFMCRSAYKTLVEDSTFPHLLEVIGSVTEENVGQIRESENGEVIPAVGFEHE